MNFASFPFFRCCVVAALAVSVVRSDMVRAETPPAPVAEFPPLTQEQFDLFLDSVRSSVPLKLPAPKVTKPIDSNTAGIWAGSKVIVTSTLGPMVLRFRRKASELVAPSVEGDVAADKTLEQFELNVDCRGKWLYLRHSNPEKKVELEGVRVRVDKPNVDTRTPFFRGQRDSGMYVSVPPFADSEKNWGVMVCPRRLITEKARTRSGLPEYALGPSAYELSEISTEFDARGDATMATAGQEGRTRMVLQISKDLPESQYVSDESVSSVPRVSVSYKPKTSFDFFRFAPYDNVQQGGLLSIEMRNKAGYVRNQYFSHAMFVRKMLEPPPIQVIADGRRVSRDLGECYVLVSFKYNWMEYDKVMPDFK